MNIAITTQHRKRTFQASCLLVLLPTAASLAAADTTVPSVIGDHMVLKHDPPASVRAWDAPRAIAKVSFRRTAVDATVERNRYA